MPKPYPVAHQLRNAGFACVAVRGVIGTEPRLEDLAAFVRNARSRLRIPVIYLCAQATAEMISAIGWIAWEIASQVALNPFTAVPTGKEPKQMQNARDQGVRIKRGGAVECDVPDGTALLLIGEAVAWAREEKVRQMYLLPMPDPERWIALILRCLGKKFKKPPEPVFGGITIPLFAAGEGPVRLFLGLACIYLDINLPKKVDWDDPIDLMKLSPGSSGS